MLIGHIKKKKKNTQNYYVYVFYIISKGTQVILYEN